MIFKRIKLNNFLSYKGEHTLEFNSGLIEICGSNGSGKSSLLAAIEWCLKGVTSTGLKAGAVIHFGEKSASVELHTDKGIIKRTQKPNRLTIDGVTVLQDALDDIAGGNIISAINASQNSIIDCTPATRQAMLNNMLTDSSMWDGVINESANTISDIKNDVVSEKAMLDRAEGYRQSILDAGVGDDTKTSRIAGLKEAMQARIEAQNAVIEAKRDNVEAAKDAAQFNMEQDTKALAIAESELACLTPVKKPDPFDNSVIDDLRIRLGLINTTIVEHTAAKKLAKDAIKNLKEAEKCSQCGSILHEVDEAVIAKHNAILEESSSSIANAETLHSIINKKLLLANQRHNDYNKSLRLYDKLLSEYDNKVASVTEAKRSCLNTYSDMVVSAQERLDIEIKKVVDNSDIISKIETIKKEQTAQQIYDIKIKKADKTVMMAKRLHAKLEKTLSDNVLTAKKLKEAALMPLNGLCSTLSSTVNKYLADALNGWSVKFMIEQETATTIMRKVLVSLTNNEGNTIPFKSLSAGQKQRMTLAANFAVVEILRNDASSNIEFFDEQLVHVDKAAKYIILDMLKVRAATLNKSLYVVEHTGNGYPYDHTVSVSMKGGQSAISLS